MFRNTNCVSSRSYLQGSNEWRVFEKESVYFCTNFWVPVLCQSLLYLVLFCFVYIYCRIFVLFICILCKHDCTYVSVFKVIVFSTKYWQCYNLWSRTSNLQLQNLEIWLWCFLKLARLSSDINVSTRSCEASSWLFIACVHAHFENLTTGYIHLWIIWDLYLALNLSGFGGAEVACWPLISKFAGSNPAEALGFLKGDKKSSARLPSEGK